MSRDTEFGRASVATLCIVFGLSRAAYYEAQKALRDEVGGGVTKLPSPAKQRTPATRSWASAQALEDAITKIVDQYPAWGVRKVHAMLRREPYGLRASRKRVWAFMKRRGLCFAAGARPAETPRGTVAVELPNRRWATDLTTVWTKEDGTVAVVPVIDCGCRSVLALEVSKSQLSSAVLSPLAAALKREFGSPGAVPDGLELRTDHGPQYTGDDCLSLVDTWRLDHTFAPVGRPTGNAVAERLIRTMKEECIWLRDWASIEELRQALENWLCAYNERRPHQALNWQTPAEVRNGHMTVAHAA